MQDATLRLLREREIEKLLLRNSLSRVDRLLLMPFRNEQNLNSFRSTNRVVLHCFRCVTPSQTGPFFSWQLSRLFIYDCFISCFRAWTFDVGLILCLTEQLYCQISRLISISAEKFCVARQRQRKQFRRVKMVGKSVYLSVWVHQSQQYRPFGCREKFPTCRRSVSFSRGPGLRGDSWPPPAARCEIIQRPIENRANIAILVFLFYFFSQSNFWCFRWMMKHPDCLDYVVKDQLMYIIPALKLTINCTRCLRPILRQWLFNKRWYEPIFLLCYYPSWWKIHDVIFSLFFLSFYLLAHFILYSCVCGIISRRIELLFVRRVLLGAPFQTALRQRWLRPRACSRKTSSSR